MARIGKSKRKQEAKSKINKPLSDFVRGVISAEVYFKLTGKGKKK